jgi:hypothetical protein
MCLYNFFGCLSDTPSELHLILTTSLDPLSVRIVRCRWHDSQTEARARANPTHHSSHASSKVCPYLVIRHDVEVSEEELQQICAIPLLDEVGDNERGCPDCWNIARSRQWVSFLPSEAEKAEVLYTAQREKVDADLALSGGQAFKPGDQYQREESTGRTFGQISSDR